MKYKQEELENLSIEELENLDDELYLNWKKVRAIKEVKKRFEVTK